ncbi:MAG: ATP-binding protein [Campylobacterota bacterium]|nr:ATP-binding protein [Campylobacterota bacterium]
MSKKIIFYRKIIFKIFILISLVLFGAFGINMILTNKMLDERIEQRILSDFDLAYNTTRNFINLVSQTSQMWAKDVASHSELLDSDRDRLKRYLQEKKIEMSADSIILLNDKGDILAQIGSEHIVDDSLAYRDIVRQTIRNQTQTTKIARERETFILYSSAIVKGEGDLSRVLMVGYFINDIFLENIKNNTHLELALIGNSAVMSSTKWGSSQNLAKLPISYLQYQNLLKNPKSTSQTRYQDRLYIVNVRELTDRESLTSGSILLAYPYDTIAKEKSRLSRKKLFIFYVIISVSLILIYIVVRKYLKTINELTDAIEDISAQKTYRDIDIYTKDEIGLLAYSFNQMGSELNILHTDMQHQIESKTKKLDELNKNLEKKVEEEVEKNRQKDKIMHFQSRLAQMGEMLSMIAHQWRQPLSAISSASAGLELKAELGKADKDTIIKQSKNITKYTHFLSETIDDFRNFFRADKCEIETSYSDIITSVLSITENSLTNKNISIIKEFNSEDRFMTYPNEIRQVILNLIKNAEDILVEKSVEDPYIKIVTHKSNNKDILEISDNGGGVPVEIIDKIFDPYFSTKLNRDGTGLGLYMSKTIIDEHCHGELTVSNTKDGALFSITL